MEALNGRRAGILLPVASLPGPYGIGDLGPSARDLIGWMAKAGQRIWQILPLTVVDQHGCPYASPTAFAREPLYLSLDDLVDDGFLSPSELPQRLSNDRVEWAQLQEQRAPLLHLIGERIAASIDLAPFIRSEPWVEEWAHFCSLRAEHGPFWPNWPASVRDLPLDRASLRTERPRANLLPYVGLQWAIDRQWRRIRQLAQAFDIELWGDLPFFVGLDSADVWGRRELFEVDPTGSPLQVSGVPPDAFSADGQLWGHPQFRRTAHVNDNWSWWKNRVLIAHRSVDVLRIDHFRGLDSVWSIPANATSAASGRWIPGPGFAPLQALVHQGARLIAEDLGIITPEVRALRDRAKLPGMAVLQFAFGPGGEVHFLPHAHRPHQVVYPGTHDNNTTQGWLEEADPATLWHLRRYFGVPHGDLLPVVLNAARRSTAQTAILSMQDLLHLGAKDRTNTPGTLKNNWSWCCPPEALNEDFARRLFEEAILSGRRADL